MSVPDVVVVEGSKRSPARSASTSDFRYGLPCGLREFGRVRPVMLGPPAGRGGVAMAATAAKKPSTPSRGVVLDMQSFVGKLTHACPDYYH